mgnify:CR=1 FL=1
MSEKLKKFTRSYVLKIAEIDSEFTQYYADLQADYKEQIAFWHSVSPIGYSIQQEDGTFQIFDDKNYLKIQEQYPFKKLLNYFVNIIINGGKNASSAYGVFYEKYKSLGPKLTKPRKDFLKKISNP